jgi:hypothetical protein
LEGAEGVDEAPRHEDYEPAHCDLEPGFEASIGGRGWVADGASGEDAGQDVACCLAEFEGGCCFFAEGIGSFFAIVLFFFVGLVVFLSGDSLEGFYIVVADCGGGIRS